MVRTVKRDKGVTMILQTRCGTVKIFLSSILFLCLFDSGAKDIICKRLDSTHPYAKKSRRKVRVGDEYKYIYQMNMDLYEKKPILQGKIIISGLQFLEKSYKLDPLKDITCDLSNGILICPKRPVSKDRFDSQDIIFPFSEVQALKNVDHKEHPPERIVDQVFNLHLPVEIFKFFSNYREMSEFKKSRFRLRRFDSRVFQGKVFISNVGNGFSGSIGDEISKYCAIQLNVKDWPLYKGDLTIPPYKQKEAAQRTQKKTDQYWQE